eukprot:TRINITY_DN4685_c0_g1_i1.p1 TRINITY_DN4685_c0_g1~~TRINITY_DN4685_c0_g1_i1.p1  ORF type:complete len:307 (+),score=31.91 TRINITY_DN4685_c0_g1_i1:93-1013(+)
MSAENTPFSDSHEFEPRLIKCLRLISTIVRFIGILVWLSISIPICWALLLLSPLHFALHKIGFEYPSPFDVAQRINAHACLFIGGITVIVKKSSPSSINPKIFVFNHSSNLDSLIASSCSPKIPVYIYKKELHWKMPFIGPLLYAYGHVPIDRANHTSAINSMQSVAKSISQNRTSLAIFPEGHRTETGKLQPLKKGAFHLAKNTGFNILPAVIEGSFSLWPPKTFFPYSGRVKISWYDDINPKESSIEEISAKVEETFSKHLNAQKKEESRDVTIPQLLRGMAGAASFLVAVSAVCLSLLLKFSF